MKNVNKINTFFIRSYYLFYIHRGISAEDKRINFYPFRYLLLHLRSQLIPRFTILAGTLAIIIRFIKCFGDDTSPKL